MGTVYFMGEHSGPASKIFVRKLFLIQKFWKILFQ